MPAPGQASNKTSQIAPKSDRPAAKMTPRNGPGAAQEAPRRLQERPRSAQERPKRDQKGIKKELRLPAGPREPSGRHFGAIFEPPGSHFGVIFGVFQGPLRRGGAPEKSRDVVCASLGPKPRKTHGRNIVEPPASIGEQLARPRSHRLNGKTSARSARARTIVEPPVSTG